MIREKIRYRIKGTKMEKVLDWFSKHKKFSAFVLISMIYSISMVLGFIVLARNGQLGTTWDMHMEVATRAVGFYGFGIISGFIVFRFLKNIKDSVIVMLAFILAQNLFYLFFLAMNSWPITVQFDSEFNSIFSTYVLPNIQKLLISDAIALPFILIGIGFGYLDKIHHVKLDLKRKAKVG